MKRFLTLVGVAVVAAAMYVAASPASQQSTGVSKKQFVALEKKVTTLSKTLKMVKSEADAAVGFLSTCLVSANAGVLPINEFGDTSQSATFGYQYNDGTNPVFNTTALDVDTTTTGFTGAYIQAVDPTCVTASGQRHAQTRSGNGHLLTRPERGLGK
jgi:hypothetical protein